jgi:hypothetical protein
LCFRIPQVSTSNCLSATCINTVWVVHLGGVPFQRVRVTHVTRQSHASDLSIQ